MDFPVTEGVPLSPVEIEFVEQIWKTGKILWKRGS
jgi:hypothetical protein